MTENKFAVTDEQEDFGALLDAFFRSQKVLEKCLAKGYIRNVTDDNVLVDVRTPTNAYISEGTIPLKEFKQDDGTLPKAGDVVDVYIERFEGRNGELVLSYERAKREAAWAELAHLYEKGEPVEGVIFDRVKGGFTVNVKGIIAFLPGSQIDVRPIKDPTPLMHIKQTFKLLRMDRQRSNIVVSRRSVMEESRSESRDELISKLSEGQVVEGEVKNITDYGAFVDLGGIDGLLHVTDMSWQRVQSPRDMLSVGDVVKVKIIRFSKENGRISLGMKQLEDDPWAGVEKRFPQGTRIKGVVTNITDYGAFVELAPGIEGLIHVSEMSWQKKPVAPSKIVSLQQEVEVVVLEVDPSRRRLSLGLKQCSSNPWETIQEKYAPGTVFEGEIKDITHFGLFVELMQGIDGIVHASDLSWDQDDAQALSNYTKGDKVQVKVLRVEPEKEQVVLGVKQLTDDPAAGARADLKKGDVVTCEITALQDAGIEVSFAGGALRGFIKKSELSRDRAEQRTQRFAVKEKVDAKITSLDAGRITLSIKARELEEERDIMAKYGSSDSGATLGEMLGLSPNALKAASKDKPTEKSAEKAEAKAPAKEAKKPASKSVAKKASDATQDAAPKKAAESTSEKTSETPSAKKTAEEK